MAMPESAHDEEAMEVAGRMGDAPSRGRLGNVSAVAYLSECRHDVYSAGRGKSGERLIYAGDPKRGIAACASCHGPGGYRIGAPALTKQNELYIDHQLHAFA
jgi:cytochrome c553